MQFYSVTKRSLAFELNPETRSFRGQIRMDLALKMLDNKTTSVLEQQIEVCRQSGQGRVLLEASILAKQVKVVEVSLLGKDSATGEFKKVKA